ncbi:MAG: hypothetical protein ACRCXN_13020 [Bacteroidales bacterium]
MKFDSALECRYAKFFTAIGWVFRREPDDRKTKTWYPDFEVILPNGKMFLIEVKPSFSFLDLSKLAISLKRGFTCVVTASSPLEMVTIFWKGSGEGLRNYLPENAFDVWNEIE